MDPITHGILGGTAALAVPRRSFSPWIVLAGATGGMLPDLDVLIRMRSEPLLSLEYHRHFSHSLLFIPFGGLIAALLVWLVTKRRHPFRKVYLAATVGYATHALLDACTTYGTVLLWPFSDQRFSWDLISILDPIFTLVILIGLVLGWSFRSPGPARISLLLALGYLGLGWMQHQKILEFQNRVAAERGQIVEKGRAYPSLGNLLVWRSFYVSRNQIHIDALRRGPTGLEKLYPGGSVPLFEATQVSPPPPPRSWLARDLNTYAWFTEGFMGRLPDPAWTVGDMRFAGLPNGVQPLWGISFSSAEPQLHVKKIRFPFAGRGDFSTLWKMILGRDWNAPFELNNRPTSRRRKFWVGPTSRRRKFWVAYKSTINPPD